MTIPPTALFDRDVTLTVASSAGAFRIVTRDPLSKDPVPALRLAFKIDRTTEKHPDKAEISIYNLNQLHRSALQHKRATCILEAGYVGNAHQIFSGDLQFSQSVLNGADWITTFHMGDGTNAFKSARVNIGLRGPVTAAQALQAAAGAMGLPLGNIPDQAAKGSQRPVLAQFVNGLVLSGKGELQMDKVAKALGLKWFIQDGAVHALGPLDQLGAQQILLAPGTGLVGSPQAGEDGIVKVRSLLQPDLLPGHGVQVQSAQVKGAFRIEKSTFVGDTWGADWYADLELRALTPAGG